jgi:hypothetical protein
MLEVYNESRLKSSFCKLCGCYTDCLWLLSITDWYVEWFVLYTSLDCLTTLTLTTGNPAYLISTRGAQLVWPVSRGCLLLLGTWSYLLICRGSMLPYTRFCICRVMITFYTLLTSLFCITNTLYMCKCLFNCINYSSCLRKAKLWV